MEKPAAKPHILPLLAAVLAAVAVYALYAWRSRAGLNSALAIGMVALAAVACVLLLWRAYVLLFVKKAALPRVFAPAALLLGLLFGLAFPVGAVPDELVHADMAYLSVNRILGVEDTPAQGQFSNVYQRVDTAMRQEDAREHALLTSEPSLSHYRVVLAGAKFWYGEEDSLPVPQTLVDLNVSPVLYAPAVAGMLLGRVVHLGYYPMLLLGRLCMLLFYVGMVWWALKLLPFGKAAVFVTALLPMSLHLACSLSYDATILALSFPLFASVMDMAYGARPRVTWAQVVRTAVLAALLAGCKVGAYLPLVFLVLLIPRDRFAKRGYRALLLCSLLAVGLLACVLSNLDAVAATASGKLVCDLIAPAEEKFTVSYLLTEPLSALRLMARTVLFNADDYAVTCVGGSLGWLNVPVSRAVIFAFFALMLFSCLHPQAEPMPVLRPGRRLLFLVPPALTALIFLVGMLLWWTPVDSPVILGIQGRYFLPVLPCLILFLPRVTLSGTLRLSEKTALPLGVQPDRVIAFLATLLAVCALASLYPLLMAR